MKVSYNWLKDLLPDLTVTPDELAERLTMHSFETTVVGKLAIDPQIIVAKIVTLEPHPNADRLRLATIDTGSEQIRVVCGAPNIVEGALVPFSPPGTTVQDDAGEPFVLKTVTIRGVESPGMLNSPRELGLGETHEGIYLLPAEAEVGEGLAKYLPDDTILDTEVTPNRAHDCLSHLGLAREIAALYEIEVKEPKLAPLPEKLLPDWSVTIENPDDTLRYLAALFTGAQAEPSPFWLQARLWAAGGKPINNIIDITNYVLFEYGQPTHTFDAAALAGRKLGVRRAREGERVTILDETEATLTAEDLVVTDDNQPVAVAGVMGGLNSGITSDTKDIVLEVANFRPYLVQETSRRLNTRSESSWRFSKGISPEQVAPAARRVAGLLRELTGATLEGVIDAYPAPQQPAAIVFDPTSVSRVIGIEVETAQVQTVLERLRFQVVAGDDTWQVTVPTDRLDVTGPHDLVEEVVRVIGLDTVTASEVSVEHPQALPHHVYWREAVRDALASVGMTETYNASFEPAVFAAIANVAEQPHLEVVNPPAPELRYLRASLLPGLLANLKTNRELLQRNAGRRESALFEVGHVYRPARASNRVPGVTEVEHVAGVIVGGTLTLADVGAAIAARLGLDDIQLTNIWTPAMQQQLKYRLQVAAFEINLTELLDRVTEDPIPLRSVTQLRELGVDHATYEPLPKYPAVYRDLSVLVDPGVTPEHVQGIIERVGGGLVDDVDLFDVYEAAEDSAATDEHPRTSYAWHVAYRSPDRTLSNEEISTLHNKIIAALIEEVAAAERGL